MANFNEFCDNVKEGFGKLGDQVEKVADIAAIRIKMTGVDGKLCEYFGELGKLTYKKLCETVTEDEEKRMETLLAMISGKIAEKKDLEAKLKNRQTSKEQKTEYEAVAEESATETAEDTPAEKPVEETGAQ